MSKEEYLKELLKWISSDSLLVIDQSGNLRCLYCPYKTICLVDFPNIIKLHKVSVEAIKLTVEIREVYIIKGTVYYIVNFSIVMA